MAEPLKNQFGPDVPRRIAAMISGVHRSFPAKKFIAQALDGYDDLELMPRGKQVATALRAHLPDDFELAARVLIESLGPTRTVTEGDGMESFLYLPHVMFVAHYGLDHFETSMRAQYELTQRFTAEFSIRPFLERHPEKTLARLRAWTADENLHVRRLVSEGTRPRLPWAPRLREFQRDPKPVLALLELLKDDPALYVRRSVANNLNDIGKDHPDTLIATARKWLRKASPDRSWIVRHALRSAIKRGDAAALEILGYAVADSDALAIETASVTPASPAIGEFIAIRCELKNTGNAMRRVMVDCRVHFVKANGRTGPKVFKLKAVELSAGEGVCIEKKISLAEMTTRKHYPGRHAVELLVNGAVHPVGQFDLMPAM